MHVQFKLVCLYINRGRNMYVETYIGVFYDEYIGVFLWLFNLYLYQCIYTQY